MRKNFLLCAVLMAAMILAPLTAMDRTAVATVKKEEPDTVSVLLSENGEVEKMDEREYLVGTLAAEADMSYHEEALKAQAVACYTYMKYQRNHNGVKGADVSDDSATCQGYINEAERKEKWKDKSDEYEKKAEKVVDSVLGETIIFEGEPILAVYHQLNSGKTESAKTVWDKEVPYLSEAESAGDRLSPDYSKTLVFSPSEFMEKAVKIKGVQLDENTEKWITGIDSTDSGYVKSLILGGQSVTGEEFRTAFGLNSCNFTVDVTEEKVTVKTLGIGHQVGMSQYGANYMAQNGSDYEQILEHYYRNIEII